MPRQRQEKQDSLEWSLPQWSEWLAQRLERRLATFRNEPEAMIAEYERERASRDSYRGRELLELLQNADDQGEGYGDNGALIRFWPEGVCVANTGLPFSEGGVDSLILSNRSPKRLARSRQIGNRGLGFRSVLTWSSHPFVLSGNLALAFSPSRAAASLKRLVDENERVRQLVAEQRRAGDDLPIPVLSCPGLVDPGATENAIGEGPWRAMWKRARQLRRTYDTVIALPFTVDGAREEALAQIGELNVELVLFLQHLAEVTIQAPGRTAVWRVERRRNSVTVTTSPDGTERMRWRVLRSKGIVPRESTDADQRGPSAFEIRIAVPEGGEAGGFLYNYFPTQVRFPYPAVVHATMELTPNRQNLVASKTNRYLVGKLAEALAAAAERTARAADPWRALELISSPFPVDTVLETLGFDQALLAASRSRRLVPTYGGGFASPVSVKRVPFDTGDWLPTKGFGNLVLTCGDYWRQRTLEWLQIETLASGEFRTLAVRASKRLPLPERAALLAGIIQSKPYRFSAADPPPALLVDDTGAPIDPHATAYLPSASPTPFCLPSWMSVEFVSADLVGELARITELANRERLAEALRDAGYSNVHAYDFRDLARAVAGQVAGQCRKEPPRADQIRTAGIAALRSLWSWAGGQYAPNRDAALQIELPTRSGDWKEAEELYIGAPYPAGILMEALLGTLHPELFVADPRALNSEDGPEAWQAFLLWLGVGRLPRTVTHRCYAWAEGAYAEHLCRTVTYPIAFREFTARSAGELVLENAEVTSIEHIREIIDQADPHAVLAWVARDDRIGSWRRQGDMAASLTGRFAKKTLRTAPHPVPSYVMWLLQTEPWLPTTAGTRCAPPECVLAGTTTDELQGVFPRPALDANVLKEFQVDRDTLAEALIGVGVRISLESVPWNRIYDLLLRLPETDPKGQAATALYRMVAEKPQDDEPDAIGRTREQQFKESGKLWACTHGEWSFVDVQEGVYLAADATIPRAVEDAFPTIGLNRGQGLEKMKSVFGVRVIQAQDIETSIDKAEELPCSGLLDDEVQRLKPYVLALRLDMNPGASGFTRFRELKVVSCSHVTGRASVHGRSVDLSLADLGDSLIARDTAYLVTRRAVSERLLDDPVVANGVGGILAAVLRVERASEFAQLAQARDADRKLLLEHKTGKDMGAALADAGRRLQVELEPTPERVLPWTLGPVARTEPQPSNVDTAVASLGGGTAPAERAGEARLPLEIEATEGDPGLAEPKRTIARREVTATPSAAGRIRRERMVMDGTRCEELVELFEVSQGRFPYPVAGLQGREAFGCDILSFATEEEREQFVESGGGRIHLVQRFIEVKGRSEPKGSVLLGGNQLSAARRYEAKYYLYRVYGHRGEDRWQVIELSDPLGYEWEVSYAVDLLRCPAAVCWEVAAASADGQNGAR